MCVPIFRGTVAPKHGSETMVPNRATLVRNVATNFPSAVVMLEDRSMMFVATVYETGCTGTERGMRTEADWQESVKRVLKSELTRKGTTYKELAERLKALGVQDITEANLKNKISRGTFSAVFFFQCLAAIG